MHYTFQHHLTRRLIHVEEIPAGSSNPTRIALEQVCLHCATLFHMKRAHVALRITATDHRAWQRAARVDGRSLSDWIIRRCNGDTATPPGPHAASTPSTKRERARAVRSR